MVALVLAFVMFAVIAPSASAAPGAKVPCGDRQAKTERVSKHSRVWSRLDRRDYRRVLYACTRGHRSRRLGEPIGSSTSSSAAGIDTVRLAGHYVAWNDSEWSSHTGDARFTVSVGNLRTRRIVLRRRFGEAAVERASLERLVLDRAGHAAWMFFHEPQAHGQRLSGRAIYRDPRCGAEVVDDSPAIAARSLRLRGKTLEWERDGTTQQAPLCDPDGA